MGNFVFENKNGIIIGKSDDVQLNAGLRYGFSTRTGGVSEGSLSSLNLGINRPDSIENLQENYGIFCSAIGINPKDTVLAKQVHSDTIIEIDASQTRGRLDKKEPMPDCDGLITQDNRVAMGIFYADCTPVLLFDVKKKILCAVHCGWRGTVKGFAAKGICEMTKGYNSSVENIHAVIGPCIDKCCFEVGDGVAQEFKRAGMEQFIYSGKTPGKVYVDLKGTNREFLLNAGVRAENITVAADCTCCNTDKYFSHRGCGADTGRMAVVAQIK